MHRLFFLGVIVIGILSGCSQDAQKVEDILIADGYSNVNVGGHAFYGCDEKDTFSNTFSAEKNGMFVEGVVCAGAFKGSTIRVRNSKRIPTPAAADSFRLEHSMR